MPIIDRRHLQMSSRLRGMSAINGTCPCSLCKKAPIAHRRYNSSEKVPADCLGQERGSADLFATPPPPKAVPPAQHTSSEACARFSYTPLFDLSLKGTRSSR